MKATRSSVEYSLGVGGRSTMGGLILFFSTNHPLEICLWIIGDGSQWLHRFSSLTTPSCHQSWDAACMGQQRLSGP